MENSASILLLFAIVLGLGSAGGYLATRLKLPALTGQVLVGVVLGSGGLNILDQGVQLSFLPITTLALSLIAVTVGGHLEFRRLHNAFRRIIVISVCQFTVVFWSVFLAFQYFNPFGISDPLRLPVHMLIASIATASSPISVIHIIKERRARGLLVKTSVAVLAINNLLTIFSFELLHGIGAALISPSFSISSAVMIAVFAEVLALGIGMLCGIALVWYCRRLIDKHYSPVDTPSRHLSNLLNGKMFTAFLLSICFTSGLCEFLGARYAQTGLHPSPVLANMMLGLVLANASAFKEDMLHLFQTLETGIFTFFFVLAGAHLHLNSLRTAWFAALLFLLVRAVSIVAGGYLGGRISKSTKRTAAHVGRMLICQGAIAISLAILLESYAHFEGIAGLVATVVVSASVVSELFGPILMGDSLKRAGEANQDRARLIEFLQEEYIDPSLHAEDKWGAIKSLCYLMCHTHRIDNSPSEVLEAIKEREQSMPTGIGLGVAVPHAKIDVGKDIIGVLGRLDPPIDFGAEDGEPARIVVMIATPPDQARKHIEVIGAISRMMSNENIRAAIFSAKTAEEIHDIIDSEEGSTFNYFIED